MKLDGRHGPLTPPRAFGRTSPTMGEENKSVRLFLSSPIVGESEGEAMHRGNEAECGRSGGR